MALLLHKNYRDFIINFRPNNNNRGKRNKNKKLNVNIYLFDALSRFVFSKEMAYTLDYIKSISKNYRIYEMLKYHTVGRNSPLNYRALIQGLKRSTSIFRVSKQNNYSTIALPGYFDLQLNLCGDSNIRYVDYNIQLFKHFKDYQLFGKKKRCLGNDHIHNRQLNILEKIYKHNYDDNISTLSYTSFMESHDSSFYSLLRMDKDFSNHLKTLNGENILNNSVIILIGDHGLHYGNYSKTIVLKYNYIYHSLEEMTELYHY